jgi:ABC-2 type transport system ATP-binding protein
LKENVPTIAAKENLSRTNAVVSVEHLKMSFDGATVIKDLTFHVQKGEVFGFLGSNGSGKTTTIRALLGIYEADSGILEINGEKFSVDSDVKLGYLPEERGLYKKEKVIDVMAYFGQLNGLKRSVALERSKAYLEQVNLLDKAHTRLDKLSGGQQQKIQLGITILHNPSLLILDEPTKGFDPVNRRFLMSIIKQRHAEGATIILVTHHMEEVEQLCDRIILLKDGVKHAYGTVDEVKKQFGSSSLEDIFVQIYSDQNKDMAKGPDYA